MGSVTKEIADRAIAGEFPEDQIVKIVKYQNAWGGYAYGVIMQGQPLDTYKESFYVKNPVTYWEAPPPTPEVLGNSEQS